MNRGRVCFTTTLLPNNKVLVTGGQGSGQLLPYCELYDLTAHTWQEETPMQGWRSNHTATLLKDGRVLVVGKPGGGAFIQETCEIYSYGANVLEEEIKLEKFSLTNFPNPFNSSTTIFFSLSQAEKVKIEIFDIRGRLVKTLLNGNEVKQAGEYAIFWEGQNDKGQKLNTGIYICCLEIGEKRQAVKMALIK
jgi:hypothetical protein